jgi:hypothetical protein
VWTTVLLPLLSSGRYGIYIGMGTSPRCLIEFLAGGGGPEGKGFELTAWLCQASTALYPKGRAAPLRRPNGVDHIKRSEAASELGVKVCVLRRRVCVLLPACPPDHDDPCNRRASCACRRSSLW